MVTTNPPLIEDREYSLVIPLRSVKSDNATYLGRRPEFCTGFPHTFSRGKTHYRVADEGFILDSNEKIVLIIDKFVMQQGSQYNPGSNKPNTEGASL